MRPLRAWVGIYSLKLLLEQWFVYYIRTLKNRDKKRKAAQMETISKAWVDYYKEKALMFHCEVNYIRNRRDSYSNFTAYGKTHGSFIGNFQQIIW